jgi:hypothetical protein
VTSADTGTVHDAGSTAVTLRSITRIASIAIAALAAAAQHTQDARAADVGDYPTRSAQGEQAQTHGRKQPRPSRPRDVFAPGAHRLEA